ncbi:MAG: trypsin-like peptidase domain-containing protein [Actinomycetota bacterium]|nr:trypsin-like peptidase domain-containing protein [Actinomycetota bacterium]
MEENRFNGEDPLDEDLAELSGNAPKNDGVIREVPTNAYELGATTTIPKATTQSAPREKKSGGGKLITGVALTALGVSFIGAYGGYKLASHGSSSTSSSTSTTIAQQNATASSTATITSSNGSANIQSILAKVEPAIVDISTSGVTSNGFFGGTSSFTAAGTGMIMTADGKVLTNAHVVANASQIHVTLLNQNKSYTATVIGSDPAHDVAVLQIQGASNLPTVTFGKSSSAQVGDSVVAIGNALALQGMPTVTSGIVSGLHRSLSTSTANLTDMIQTDAPINPGNSGGPLLNSSGQVIGMNTAIYSGTGTEPAQNIGFAEAIDSVLPVVQQIEAHPNTSSTTNATAGYGYLGVGVQAMSPALASQVGVPSTTTGALVVQVSPGSPAANAGLNAGSVITGVNATTITSDTELVKVIHAFKAGTTVTLRWVDSQGSHSAPVTLASAPVA